MTRIDADQIEMLETQGNNIDATYSEIAGILKQRDLDPVAKKKLTRVIGMLNKVSALIADLVDTEEGPPAKPKVKKTPAKKKAAALRTTRGGVKRSR